MAASRKRVWSVGQPYPSVSDSPPPFPYTTTEPTTCTTGHPSGLDPKRNYASLQPGNVSSPALVQSHTQQQSTTSSGSARSFYESVLQKRSLQNKGSSSSLGAASPANVRQTLDFANDSMNRSPPPPAATATRTSSLFGTVVSEFMQPPPSYLQYQQPSRYEEEAENLPPPPALSASSSSTPKKTTRFPTTTTTTPSKQKATENPVAPFVRNPSPKLLASATAVGIAHRPLTVEEQKKQQQQQQQQQHREKSPSASSSRLFEMMNARNAEYGETSQLGQHQQPAYTTTMLFGDHASPAPRAPPAPAAGVKVSTSALAQQLQRPSGKPYAEQHTARLDRTPPPPSAVATATPTRAKTPTRAAPTPKPTTPGRRLGGGGGNNTPKRTTTPSRPHRRTPTQQRNRHQQQQHPEQPDIDNMTYQEILDWQEKVGIVKIGVPSDVLKRLPTLTVRTPPPRSGGTPCSICLDSFGLGSRMKCLPCDHGFHEECIDAWLAEHTSCPMCKADVAAAGATSVGNALKVMRPW